MEDFEEYEEMMENKVSLDLDLYETEDMFYSEEYFAQLEMDYDFDSEYDRYREF